MIALIPGLFFNFISLLSLYGIVEDLPVSFDESYFHPQQSDSTNLLSGQVFYDESDTLTEGTVELYQIPVTKQNPEYSTSINSDGYYQFDQVQKGDYLVLVKAGLTFPEVIDGYYSKKVLWFEADTLSFGDSTTNRDLFTYAEPNVQELDVTIIEGTVQLVNSDGNSFQDLPDITVSVFRKTSSRNMDGDYTPEEFTLVGVSQTDEDGHFIFGNMPLGVFMVRINYPFLLECDVKETMFEIPEPIQNEPLVEEVEVNFTVEENCIAVEISKIYEDDELTSVGVEAQWQVYPNPASQQINIEVPDAYKNKRLDIYITDMSGKLFWQAHLNSHHSVSGIDVSQLKKGIYFLQVKIEYGATLYIERIVKY